MTFRERRTTSFPMSFRVMVKPLASQLCREKEGLVRMFFQRVLIPIVGAAPKSFQHSRKSSHGSNHPMEANLLGGLEPRNFMTFQFISYSYMGCHPKPIDEVHDFSKGLLHHQAEMDHLPPLDMLRKERCWDPKYSKKSLKSPGVLLKGLLKVAILAKKSEKSLKKSKKYQKTIHAFQNRKKRNKFHKKSKENNIFQKKTNKFERKNRNTTNKNKIIIIKKQKNSTNIKKQ